MTFTFSAYPNRSRFYPKKLKLRTFQIISNLKHSFLMWFETLSRSFCSRKHNTFHEKCQLLPELAILLNTSLQLLAHLSNQLRFGLSAPFEGQNIVYKLHSREHNTFHEKWHLLYSAHPNRSRFYPQKVEQRTFQIICNLKTKPSYVIFNIV